MNEPPTIHDILAINAEAEAFAEAVVDATQSSAGRTKVMVRKIARIFEPETEAQCWAALACMVGSLMTQRSREERMHMQAGFILLVNAALEETDEDC
jgi:hypothetical protein